MVRRKSEPQLDISGWCTREQRRCETDSGGSRKRIIIICNQLRIIILMQFRLNKLSGTRGNFFRLISCESRVQRDAGGVLEG